MAAFDGRWLSVVASCRRYSYAIVGINLTEMAYSLLRIGALKPHFYNTVSESPKMEHFHQLYCEWSANQGRPTLSPEIYRLS